MSCCPCISTTVIQLYQLPWKHASPLSPYPPLSLSLFPVKPHAAAKPQKSDWTKYTEEVVKTPRSLDCCLWLSSAAASASVKVYSIYNQLAFNTHPAVPTIQAPASIFFVQSPMSLLVSVLMEYFTKLSNLQSLRSSLSKIAQCDGGSCDQLIKMMS